MTYFLPFLATFSFSLVFTGILWRLGLKYGILAKPRKRDVHKLPVPRIGGIGIFSAFLVVSLAVFLIFHKDFRFGNGIIWGLDSHLVAILFGGFIITFTMFLDDLAGLSAKTKLLIQAGVALLVISCGIGIDYITNPFGGTINLNSVYIPLFSLNGIVYHFSLWSDLLTLVWLVGLMNIMNFVDGVDGLAGGQASIAAFTIFLLSISVAVSQPTTAMVSIILSGAILGFLVWNFPPAKIFMGDSGSMFLGFMLGILALISGGKLATVLLVMGFPIVDGLIVVAGRLARGKNPLTTPDKTHLHHRFLAVGFTPRQAILALYAISIAFAAIALSSSTKGKIIGFGGLVILLLIILALLNLGIMIKKRQLAKN